jgi:hypothetical protein
LPRRASTLPSLASGRRGALGVDGGCATGVLECVKCRKAPSFKD